MRNNRGPYLRFAGFSDEEDDFDDDLPESLLLEELFTLAGLPDLPDDDLVAELPALLFDLDAGDTDSFLMLGVVWLFPRFT
jgi:hypothetical protein